MSVRAWSIAVALGVLTTPAAAHIDVLPAEFPAEAPLELTVRVPTEGGSPTTAITLRIPAQIVVSAIGEPPPGWRARAINTADGRLGGVEWTGGRIAPGRYQDFTLLGLGAAQGTATFTAVQRFADGSRAEWSAGQADVAEEPAAGAPGPSPVVNVLAPGAAPAATAASSDEDSSNAGIWLGLIAIGIAALAALATGLLWSNRPMRLPDDE